MATMREFATKQEFWAYICGLVAREFPQSLPNGAKISAEEYAKWTWPDERIGWAETHIVTLEGYGVLGFTDGPVESLRGGYEDFEKGETMTGH